MKMENGAYVSSPQLPPQAHLSAAAAFQAAAANSAAAGGGVTPFQEALMSRMGRPFGLTVSNFTISSYGRDIYSCTHICCLFVVIFINYRVQR